MLEKTLTLSNKDEKNDLRLSGIKILNNKTLIFLNWFDIQLFANIFF